VLYIYTDLHVLGTTAIRCDQGEDNRRFTFKPEISLLASFEPSFVHASRDEYPPLTALHAAAYAREVAKATTADSGGGSGSSSAVSKVYDSATDAALTIDNNGDDDRNSKSTQYCCTIVQSLSDSRTALHCV
jgi:hypothetical protein